MTYTEDPSMWHTPIVDTVESLQDEGRNVWIAGFGAHHALIIDADNDQVTVAHVETCNGLGRWECSKQHYDAFQSLYNARFPLR